MKEPRKMNYYGLILPGAILATLMLIALKNGGWNGFASGFRETGKLLRDVAPNLAIGFTLAGFLTALLPQDLVAKWMGEGSGLRGIFVGTAAGALTPGGPFTHFPILASLIVKGAGVGPVCSYIAAWALIGVHRILIWEGPILGWKFVALRVAACVVFPPLAGILAAVIASIAKYQPNP